MILIMTIMTIVIIIVIIFIRKCETQQPILV